MAANAARRGPTAADLEQEARTSPYGGGRPPRSLAGNPTLEENAGLMGSPLAEFSGAGTLQDGAPAPLTPSRLPPPGRSPYASLGDDDADDAARTRAIQRRQVKFSGYFPDSSAFAPSVLPEEAEAQAAAAIRSAALGEYQRWAVYGAAGLATLVAAWFLAKWYGAASSTSDARRADASDPSWMELATRMPTRAEVESNANIRLPRSAAK